MNRERAAPMAWTRDGSHWPHRERSRFIEAAGLSWHVQQFGAGTPLLLVHGTGASTHSWRALAPLLARRFAVTCCDLPGHGFTAGVPHGGMSLPGISAALSTLLEVLQVSPALVIGHSAGAAILARMSLDGQIAARGIVSLNGALLPLESLPSVFFSPLARLLATSSLTARFFAWSARDRSAVERLIAGTGSTLDDAGIDLYWRLVRNPAHVDGALQMMAHWDLQSLSRELPALSPRLTLVVGDADRTIPPTDVGRVCRLLPRARVINLPRLGHLAHEERADLVAEIIESVTDSLTSADTDA